MSNSETPSKQSVLILIADDDEDDQLFAKEAFQENCIANKLQFVNDGVALLDYLKRRNQYADPADSPLPGLILLDLNMPKIDGREALKEIKADPTLRHIPVVILTTSKAEQDAIQMHQIGADGFINKPVVFADFIDLTRKLDHFWFDIVQFSNQSNP